MVKYQVEFEATGEITDFPTLSDAIRYVKHCAHHFGGISDKGVQYRIDHNLPVTFYERYMSYTRDNNGELMAFADGHIKKVE